MQVELASLWPEAVFHVLAHVSASASAAGSLFDANYVNVAAAALGDARSRTLGEDALRIAAHASDHDALVDLQSLAWLFRDEAHARRWAESELAAIPDAELESASLAPRARRAGAFGELLRAAAELELEVLASWPRPTAALAELGDAVRLTSRAAPALTNHRVACVRSLGRRGRVHDAQIWVGLPGSGAFAPTALDAAWLAAHEATVHETRNSQPALTHDALESAALARLAARASAAGLEREHAAWAQARGWLGWRSGT